MKYYLLAVLIIAVFTSCNGEQSDTKKQAVKIQTAMVENRPGTMPAKEGS